MQYIQCPNCRKTTQVISLNNLPENEEVFKNEPQMFTMNVFSPYETAKRLSVESKSLIKTGERYLQFLGRLQDIDINCEKEIVKNYEEEFRKVESYKEMMIKIINDCSKNMKDRLL